jgi:PAS domain S-box-containing protein
MNARLKYVSEKETDTIDKPQKSTQSYPKFISSVKPLNQEISLDAKKYLLSKTDSLGNIEYCNSYFCEITGYDEEELIGKPHSIVRHPDMPGAIFHLMWNSLHRREPVHVILKNMRKDGRFYWIHADINIKINKASNEIIGYFAYQKKVPDHVITTIAPLYTQLQKVENDSGLEASVRYLSRFLEQSEKSYAQYIEEVLYARTFTYKLAKLKKRLLSNNNTHDSNRYTTLLS